MTQVTPNWEGELTTRSPFFYIDVSSPRSGDKPEDVRLGVAQVARRAHASDPVQGRNGNQDPEIDSRGDCQCELTTEPSAYAQHPKPSLESGLLQ